MNPLNKHSVINLYTSQELPLSEETQDNLKKELDGDYIPRSIGERKWELVNEKNGEVLPTTKEIEEVLNSKCPWNEEKKIGETHKLKQINSLQDLLDEYVRGLHNQNTDNASKEEESPSLSTDWESALERSVKMQTQFIQNKQ